MAKTEGVGKGSSAGVDQGALAIDERAITRVGVVVDKEAPTDDV
jgi:hypothetical protein